MRLVLAAYRLLDRRGRVLWLSAIPITVMIALLEGFAMGLLFPVIQVIADGDVSDAPDTLGWVADLTGAQEPGTIVGWAVGICRAGSCRAGLCPRSVGIAILYSLVSLETGGTG